jgi:hypothetical protein
MHFRFYLTLKAAVCFPIPQRGIPVQSSLTVSDDLNLLNLNVNSIIGTPVSDFMLIGNQDSGMKRRRSATLRTFGSARVPRSVWGPFRPRRPVDQKEQTGGCSKESATGHRGKEKDASMRRPRQHAAKMSDKEAFGCSSHG